MTSETDPPREHRLLATDVTNVPLTHESHAGLWVDNGWPVARALQLAEFADGASVSIYEVTQGAVSDIENDECLVVLGGEGRLEFEDGEVIDLRPGVCVRLHAGDRTEWTVRTTMRALTVTSH